MSTTAIAQKRPLLITIICILGFIGGILVIPIVFSPMVEEIATWYPYYFAFTALVGFISLLGLWFMKKWGAYSYAGLTILNQIIALVMGLWNFMVLLIPFIVVVVSFIHISKMK